MKALAALAFLFGAACIPFAAAAENVAIGVDPMVFEFTASAGQVQSGSIAITNSGDVDEIVFAKPIDWRTDASGDVVFETAGSEGAHSLTNQLQLSPASFTLHPGERRNITVVLRAGKTISDTAWGGFILKAAAGGAEAASIAPGATVFIYNTAGPVVRHVRMTQLKAAVAGSAANFSAMLLNDGTGYVRPSARLLLYSGSTVVRRIDIPVSVIFPHARRDLRGSIAGIRRGSYAAHLIVDYGGDSVVDGITGVRVP